MGYEAKGKLHSISETQQVSERFSKREFVVETADNPKYPQLVQFQLTGARCEQLDGLMVGDEVALEFSIRGRRWDGPKGTKYFVELDVWRVNPIGERKAPPQQPSSRAVTAGSSTGTMFEDESDIPFASCDVVHEPSPIARVLR